MIMSSLYKELCLLNGSLDICLWGVCVCVYLLSRIYELEIGFTCGVFYHTPRARCHVFVVYCAL